MRELDNHDRRLLQELQRNNQLTTAELSHIVNLSQSAVQRRIAKLRQEKIIEADIAVISPKAIGMGITCVIDIVLHEGNSKAIDKFKEAMQACVEVAQCYYVTGTYDFVLIVHMKDMSHFESFSKKHLMDNPNLKHFYTHVVMDSVKVSYGIMV